MDSWFYCLLTMSLFLCENTFVYKNKVDYYFHNSIKVRAKVVFISVCSILKQCTAALPSLLHRINQYPKAGKLLDFDRFRAVQLSQPFMSHSYHIRAHSRCWFLLLLIERVQTFFHIIALLLMVIYSAS